MVDENQKFVMSGQELENLVQNHLDKTIFGYVEGIGYTPFTNNKVFLLVIQDMIKNDTKINVSVQIENNCIYIGK